MSEARKCDVCQLAPATVHMTQIVKNTVKKLHLCEECNREQEPISPEVIAAILPKAHEIENVSKELATAPMATASEPKVACTNCGLTYEDFKRYGRFGCAEDYAIFGEFLDPIFERIHKATAHVGRVPPNTDRTAIVEVRLRTLEAELASAIASEDYERAAQVRDQIKTERGGLHGAG